MTDLEITKLCAEALPLVVQYSDLWGKCLYPDPRNNAWSITYDPLHDDAQAMALVKKLRLHIQPCEGKIHGIAGWWRVGKPIDDNELFKDGLSSGPDLNRAICECVAKMQKAKA